jgi:hypothetical protein
MYLVDLKMLLAKYMYISLELLSSDKLNLVSNATTTIPWIRC